MRCQQEVAHEGVLEQRAQSPQPIHCLFAWHWCYGLLGNMMVMIALCMYTRLEPKPDTARQAVQRSNKVLVDASLVALPLILFRADMAVTPNLLTPV
jgi:hypothetical protein